MRAIKIALFLFLLTDSCIAGVEYCSAEKEYILKKESQVELIIDDCSLVFDHNLMVSHQLVMVNSKGLVVDGAIHLSLNEVEAFSRIAGRKLLLITKGLDEDRLCGRFKNGIEILSGGIRSLPQDSMSGSVELNLDEVVHGLLSNKVRLKYLDQDSVKSVGDVRPSSKITVFIGQNLSELSKLKEEFAQEYLGRIYFLNASKEDVAKHVDFIQKSKYKREQIPNRYKCSQ